MKLKQHNAITEARYHMTALEKNIVYMLMSKISEDDEGGELYTMDFAELKRRVGNFTEEEFDKATTNLITRPYTIYEDNGKSVLVTSLMTAVHYHPKTKEFKIRIASMILPYYIQLKKDYTVFFLDIALALRSKYAKRIYEMLSQHKDAGIMHITVDELKYRLALKDPQKLNETYDGWTAFRKAVLETAKKELQEHADIAFTYEAKKTGKKYTDLTFHITPSKNFKSKVEKVTSF